MVRSTSILFSLLISSAVFAVQPASHDPTKPVDATYSEQADDDNIYGLKIDSIKMTKANKSVIINGQHLKIGDKINELTVVDIYPSAVKLKDANEEITIKIPYSEIKQPVVTPAK